MNITQFEKTNEPQLVFHDDVEAVNIISQISPSYPTGYDVM